MSYTVVPHRDCWQNLIVPTESPPLGPIFGPTLGPFRDNGAGSTGTYAWLFSPTQLQNRFFIVPLPHSYWEGTNLDFHVLWSPTTAAAGNVTWGLEYTWANINDTIPATSIVTVTSPTSLVAYKHHITVLSTISGTGKKIRSTFLGRIFRDVDNNDTYPANVALLEVSLTFKQNTMGSYAPVTK